MVPADAIVRVGALRGVAPGIAPAIEPPGPLRSRSRRRASSDSTSVKRERTSARTRSSTRASTATRSGRIPGRRASRPSAGPRPSAQGQVAFGLMATYLSRPVILRVASPGPGGSDQYAVDNQVNGELPLRLRRDPSAAARLRAALHVRPDRAPARARSRAAMPLHDTAVRDLRFGFAYALVPRERISPDAPGRERTRAPGRSPPA